MSWVLALPMCQEILMVIEILAYKINKFKTGHPVVYIYNVIRRKNISMKFQSPSNEVTPTICGENAGQHSKQKDNSRNFSLSEI